MSIFSARRLEAADLKFELTVAQDGAEALAFVRGEGKYSARSVPDLVVLDLNLPKGGGIEVLRAIRQRETFSIVSSGGRQLLGFAARSTTKPANSALTGTSRSPLIWKTFLISAKYSKSCS